MRAFAFAFAIALALALSGCVSESEPQQPAGGAGVIGPAGPQRNATANATGNLTVETEEVFYFDGTKGYLARPSGEGDYPGVVMVHEWWGLNEHIKGAARELASEGYVVLAVDLYRGEVANDSARARNLTMSLNQGRAIMNMHDAAVYLRQKEGAGKVAALGWCFGGGQVMQFSLSGEPLDATVIYYGNLVTDEGNLSRIEWPVLGIFGENDTSVRPESARAFDAALDNAGVENEIYVYPGVGHAFANPSGGNYAPQQARDAWVKTLRFLDRHLK